MNDKNGETWVFFRSDKNDLCYRLKSGKENILQEGVRKSFDITTDSEGCFHLVTQTDSGTMIYLIYDHSNWRKYVILNSRSAKNEMLKFKIFVCGGKIHCFYILSFNGKSMLVHHIFNAMERIDAPNVISYTDTAKNFSCCCDTNGNIHIFFFDEDSKFRYKIYSLSNKNYADSIVETDDDIKNISAVCSQNGKIHLLYTAKIKAYYALIYYNPDEKERKILNFGEPSPTDTCIFTKGDSVFAQWRERNVFYRCISENGGAFKKPTPIGETKSRRAYLIRVRTAENPQSLNCDFCIALSDGKTFDTEYGINRSSPQKTISAEKTQNHKTDKNNYNIIDGEVFEQIRFMKSKIYENKKELTRLNTIINALSEKIASTEKSQKVTQNTGESHNLGSDLGNINTENYEFFKNTDINDINFENSKNFDKENQ